MPQYLITYFVARFILLVNYIIKPWRLFSPLTRFVLLIRLHVFCFLRRKSAGWIKEIRSCLCLSISIPMATGKEWKSEFGLRFPVLKTFLPRCCSLFFFWNEKNKLKEKLANIFPLISLWDFFLLNEKTCLWKVCKTFPTFYRFMLTEKPVNGRFKSRREKNTQFNETSACACVAREAFTPN